MISMGVQFWNDLRSLDKSERVSGELPHNESQQSLQLNWADILSNIHT